MLGMTSTAKTSLDDLPEYLPWVEVVKTYTKCHQLLSRRLAELELTTAAHEVLLAIGRREGQLQKDLARRLLVVKSNVTGLLGRLEARGLVRRVSDRDDGRARRVFLTPQGHRLLARSSRCQADVVRTMGGNLSERQLRDLRSIMRTVGETLDSALAEG